MATKIPAKRVETYTTEDGKTYRSAPMDAFGNRPPDIDLAAVDMSRAGTYRKPHTIRAVQLGKEGGDWVAEDSRGQRWLITNDVFLQNYTRV